MATVAAQAAFEGWRALPARVRPRLGGPPPRGTVDRLGDVDAVIVCTPQEAIECFRKTKMDVLYLGNYAVRREGER